MRSIKLFCGSLLLVGVLCSVTPAGALAGSTLRLKTATGALAAGAPLRSFSTNLTFNGSNGVSVTCKEAIVTGTLTANEAASDRGQVTAYEAKGNHEVPGACNGGTAGPVLFTSTELPWTLALTAKGAETISGKIDIELMFPHEGNLACLYEAKSLAYSFNLSGPVTSTAEHQSLRGSKPNSGSCPESGEFSGSFALSSNGETVEAELVGGALGSDGSIEGAVTGAGNAGVAGVTVTACNEEEPSSCFSAVSQPATGHYDVPNVPEGIYSLTATPTAASGYGNTAGGSLGVVGGVATQASIALLEAGAVAGTVTGAASAVQGGVAVTLCTEATETLATACYSTTTNLAGEYEFTEVPDGEETYVVSAEPAAPYARTFTSEVTVAGRATTTEDIALREAGSVTGIVESGHGAPVEGAIVSVCEEFGGCTHATTNSLGEYTVSAVPDGEAVASVFPPTGYAAAISTRFTVVGTGATVENLHLLKPTTPPPGTTVTGFTETTVGGATVPVVNWESEAPMTTTGCVGGTVAVTITGRNSLTGAAETTTPVTLSETPASSGKFAGRLPKAYPIHGETKTKIKVTGCTNPVEEEETEFTIYIDPSGIVVDGDAADAPVDGATVTLLSSATLTGAFSAVANGSNVMSPANRVNPDATNAAGEFGWDTLPGYYRVQATKEDCGTVTTPAFEVPPPVTDLKLVLHCLLRIATSSLAEATRGTPYEATLTATGADAPFKWKKTAALPKGLKLSKTGTLSGTISAKHVAAGSYTVAVEVTDAKKHTAKESLTLKVS